MDRTVTFRFLLYSEDENFDFFWCTIEWMRDNFDHKYLADHVRLCHFRNHFELTRKNLMVRNLKRAKKKIEKETGCGSTNAQVRLHSNNI